MENKNYTPTENETGEPIPDMSNGKEKDLGGVAPNSPTRG